MCGIAGIVGDIARDGGRARVERMIKRIVHRGPDDQGLWATDGFAFGMRRLAIIDLPGGHQPMFSEDGIGIVFNGEIYNYRELHRQLESNGVHFSTDSDTEVILQLYRQQGITGIQRLQGMFAICLYDPLQGKMHLIRDRIGIKPLYYGHDGQRLLFASELKALLAGFEARPALNHTALAHYLAFRFVPGPDCIWEGVHKLPPGQRLELDLNTGESSLQTYWTLEFSAGQPDPGQDYLAGFSERFLAAVEDRILAADVPVGVLLSGGLDSSAVAAAIAELGHRHLNSFSVAFEEGGDYSELEYARQVADHVGMRHHEVVITQADFMRGLEEMPWQTDEPLADLAAIPLHAVCRLAREQVTVVLSGEGADELLCGYDMEQKAAQLEHYRTLQRRLPGTVLRAGGALLQRFGRGQALAIVAAQGWQGLYRAQGAHMTRCWLGESLTRLLREPLDGPTPEETLDRWYAASGAGHPLEQLQSVYFQQWLVEDLLMKADKMSMASSLELRVPFLDHRLVEWAARLPRECKVGSAALGWSSKRILRQFAARRLPRSIIERPKRGFPVPANRWLQGDLAAQLEARLQRSGNPLHEFIHPGIASEALRRAHRGDAQAAARAWTVVVLDYWCERWLCD